MSSCNRRYPRILAQHVVMVRLQGSRPLEEFARTRTLGLGGCMFVSEEPLGHGNRLELAISLAGRVLRADSRVVYEKELRGAGREVGVEFVQMDVNDRRFLEAVVSERLEG